VMKILAIILTSICAMTGCKLMSRNTNDIELSRVMVIFRSSDKTVDLLEVSGLDMGPMYSSKSHTPKYVGDKGYTSYDEVRLEELLTIRWRLSADHSKAFEQEVARPHNIPEIIPRNRNVIFLHTDGQWTILLE